MMTNTIKHRRWMSILSMCLITTVLLTGCEPLRKKFIRQKKKKEETSDFIPVLEPQEYPVKKNGPIEEYAQQYSLFNVWLSDFADNFQRMNNKKRLINDLDAAIKAIDDMGKFLQGSVVDDLGKAKQQVQYLREEYDKPNAFRNISRMNTELRSLHATMVKKFKPKMVKEYLIAE